MSITIKTTLRKNAGHDAKYEVPYLEMHNPSTRNLTKMDIVDN